MVSHYLFLIILLKTEFKVLLTLLIKTFKMHELPIQQITFMFKETLLLLTTQSTLVTLTVLVFTTQ